MRIVSDNRYVWPGQSFVLEKGENEVPAIPAYAKAYVDALVRAGAARVVEDEAAKEPHEPGESRYGTTIDVRVDPSHHEETPNRETKRRRRRHDADSES